MSDPEQILIGCPKCQKSFEVDAAIAGRHGRCDACGHKFLIEGAADARVSAVKSKSSGSRLVTVVLVLFVVGAAGLTYLNFLVEPSIEPLANEVLPRKENVEPSPASKESAPEVDAESVERAELPEKENLGIVNRDESQKGRPEKELEPLEESFAVVTQFEQVDIRQYRQTYPPVFMGWLPSGADQAKEAKLWGSYLGPLGVRICPHVPQLQTRPAFASIVPLSLQSQTGELALTAAEVVDVAQGSPADGHLQVGDLIIGIEGEMLKSGNAYRPDWKFMHKDARELQLMLGEKIDQAQGRGDIRLSVLRMPAGSEQALPVSDTELWVGEGGNQSVGEQSFDVEIPGDGMLTLQTSQFDESLGGDGSWWMDVVVEGDYGEVNLFELPSITLQAGYGRAFIQLDEPLVYQGKTYQQTLNLHANGVAKWQLPKGTKRVRGKFAASSWGQVQPKVWWSNSSLPLSGVHQDSLVELRFPIGRVGSFSETYPKDCEKTERTVARHTDWLAAQQREDGSWPRLAGYTRDAWDTAWCGLALMSSGDAKYDAQVRKAAYRVAYADAPSEWIAERAMRLIFLSEYYLKTRDAQIVSGIQAAYEQVLDCAKTDFMAGHKVNGFGYGIAGQHYGTGHLAMALALASRTPISFNREFVDSVIRHAGEVCVNGTYAYGRGRRLARSSDREYSGGNAMSGSGLLGVQIGGGHETAVRELVERMEASLGDGDNSHATSSLAFIFASLALASADEEVFIKHMQNFRYKMTLDDNWEGGILKSAFPLDFQGGEGVTANWIRSAGTILVFNALKRELAITGNRELWAEERIQTQPVSEWGGQVHSYYLRNWCLAQELLGSRAPKSLREGIRRLSQLPRDENLVTATRALVEKGAPILIREIASNASLSPRQRGYAAELISGVDFKIYTTKSNDQQEVDLAVNLPFHQLNWLDEDKTTMFADSSMKLSARVEILGENLAEPIEFATEGVEGFNLDLGERKLKAKVSLKDANEEVFDGVAKISFKIGGTKFSYSRPLKFNAEYSDSNHYNLRRLRLKLRVAPRAYFQSQPMIIAGLPFDCMYPVERMLEIQGPKEGVDVLSHEGDRVLVDLSSENFICPWIYSVKFETESQVKILRARGHEMLKGKMEGDFDSLYDFSNETMCGFIGENSKAVIEFDFGKRVRSNGLDAHFNGSRFMRIWYLKGETWVPLVWDNYSVGTGHHPVFPETTARLWRVEIEVGGKLDLQTLRFYHNPNTVFERRALPQSMKSEFLPPIQPISN